MKQIFTLLLSILSITTFAQNWDEVIKAVASDRAGSDFFGLSVSISGDKAIVGAYAEDEDATGGNTLSLAGSAYIFELSGGVWSQTAKLVASDRAADDLFGYSVSISGDKAIVGAYTEDEDATGGNTLSGAGSAYIFEFSGGVWFQTAKLVASDRGTNDRFGDIVSISGDKAIVGVRLEDQDASGLNTLTNAGSAYVFELNGGTWSETAKLVASDRGQLDGFGISVSISGDKAIVGAYTEDEDASGLNTLSGAGSAYVFELSGGVWSQTAKLVASDRGVDDWFGYSVSISGDKAIIGAYQEDEDISGLNTLSKAGSAYVFELNGGTWSETAKLVASDRGANDWFGYSVSISGDKAIIGAYQEDEDISGGNTLSLAGSAYVFELSGGTWSETAKLVASDRGASDYFGRSVSISGDKVIVGAPYEDEDATGGATALSAGSVYIFELNGGVGVDELGLSDANFKLYPNPTTGNITIDLTELENANVSIINSIGVEVFKTTNVTQNKLAISLTEFSNGIYFVKIQSGNEFFTQKIIKQ